ncbi:hypothetical protein ACH5RR_027771 [Cinchona calisaya]|uniref:Uncharacterized protein n=1 Tax=Cinchona calisaya TaxID=153742 RepID=A0ABD2YLT2_9GENT
MIGGEDCPEDYSGDRLRGDFLGEKGENLEEILEGEFGEEEGMLRSVGSNANNNAISSDTWLKMDPCFPITMCTPDEFSTTDWLEVEKSGPFISHLAGGRLLLVLDLFLMSNGGLGISSLMTWTTPFSFFEGYS